MAGVGQTLVTPEPKLSRTQYATGDVAPDTGVYHVTHGEHHLPEEITLVRGQNFPRCAECALAVSFGFLRPTQSVLPPGTMTLNELPVLDDDGNALAS